MAYVPVSQAKKTSGYVPVTKKTPTLQSQFPVKQLISRISSPSYAPVKSPQTKAQAVDKVVSDKKQGVSLSQGQPEKLSPFRSLIRAIPGNSRFEQSLENDFYEPIAKVGRFLAPTVSDRMREIVDEKPNITDAELQSELKNRISKEGIALTGKDGVITPDTRVFSPDIVGMIRKVPAKLAERFIGTKTADEAARLAREIGIKNPSKTILDDIIKINDESTAQRFVDKLKADKVVPTTDPLPALPKLTAAPEVPPTPVRTVAAAVDNTPNPRNFKTADEFIKSQESDLLIKNDNFQAAVVEYNALKNKISQEVSDLIKGGEGNPVKAKELQSKLSTLKYPDPEDFGIKTRSQLTDLFNQAQKTTPAPTSFIPDYVVQVAEKDGPGVKIFRIPEEDFSEVKRLVDDGRTPDTPIAMGLEMKDGVFHITAKTPEVMLSNANVTDGGFITAKQLGQISKERVAATKPNLPALPKLPPEIRQRLESKQADETINRAVLDRYKKLATRPDVVDSAMVKEAKSTTVKGDTSKFFGKLLTPIASRLSRIDESLGIQMRKMEFAVNQNTKKSIDAVRPLMVGSSKMSPADRKLFSLARLNGDDEVRQALATKYGLTDELKKVDEALEDVRLRANEVGMDISKRENYSPRSVKNPKAYLNYWRSQSDWGDINRLIEEEAKKKGIKYGDLMKDQEKVVSIINNYIRGYGNKTVLASPSFSKQRRIAVLDEELAEFYEDADNALTTYMIRMNDEIEGRRFFGKKADGDGDISDSIGSYVMDLVAKGKIKPQQQEEVGEIIRARFSRGKMYGAVDLYRNLEYISTMGSPTSALTQIGDFAWSLAENGMWKTGKAIFGKNKITRADLGLDSSIMNEFTRDTWSGRAVDKTFKLIGLDRMARLGQENFVNANLAKLQQEARKGDDVLNATVKKLFDADEADQVLKDLSDGKVTEDVKFMVFSNLLDYQPLTKSEMPQVYLENPNGRLFYMLKSFTLKQYDISRRKGFDLIATGEPAKVKQGVKNLVKIATLFMLANATSDEIKDLLLGRETPPSDRLIDNLWRLAGASKYDVYKARQDGIGTTVARKILFPASIWDRASKDFETIVTDKEYEKGPLAGENYKFESTQTIPVGGKLYYWWFGRGAQKEEYKEGSGQSTGGAPSLPELPKLPKLPKLPQI